MQPHEPTIRSAANLRPGDLATSEAGVARWFGALPRCAPPGALGTGMADAPPRAQAPRRSAPVWRPLVAAAALLFVFVAPGRVAPTDSTYSAARFTASSSSLLVIDDPSVPALHAFDTFEQLAWVDRSTNGTGAPR